MRKLLEQFTQFTTTGLWKIACDSLAQIYRSRILIAPPCSIYTQYKYITSAHEMHMWGHTRCATCIMISATVPSHDAAFLSLLFQKPRLNDFQRLTVG